MRSLVTTTPTLSPSFFNRTAYCAKAGHFRRSSSSKRFLGPPYSPSAREAARLKGSIRNSSNWPCGLRAKAPLSTTTFSSVCTSPSRLSGNIVVRRSLETGTGSANPSAPLPNAVVIGGKWRTLSRFLVVGCEDRLERCSSNPLFSRAFTTVTKQHMGSGKGQAADFTDVSKLNERRPVFINLSKRERKICRLLEGAARNHEAKGGSKVQVRIAGGWVRDKLLGLPCTDIDVGVDTMIGYDFANLVNAHMEANGFHKKNVFRITANHERSKHLETSTMIMMGIPIDFANLRSEVLDASNRVLNESIFGSPYEDAYHRDFTINALFYNIHTDSVEDYTGKGLDDLRDGWIRTPLAAYDTFWQDPLRILRCIRFATRFNFQIAADAKQAMLDPTIKKKLQTKISVERVGREFMMMVDNAAGRSVAMRLLQENGLYDAIFPIPVKSVLVKGVSAVTGERHDIEDAFRLAWIMEWLLKINPNTERNGKDADVAVFLREEDQGRRLLLKQTQGVPMTSHLYPLSRSEPPPGVPFNVPGKEDANLQEVAARNLIYAAMLYPYRDMTATINNNVIPTATCIYRYSLKGRKIDIDAVKKMQENIEGAKGVVNSISLDVPMDDEQRRKEMIEIGMFIRNIAVVDTVNKKWPCALLFTLGVELLPKFEQLKQGVLDEEAKVLIAKYNLFLSKARYYEIDHCFSWRHIVDSADLSQELRIPPGPQLSRGLRQVMLWQVQHPTSSKEDCLEWIAANPDKFE